MALVIETKEASIQSLSSSITSAYSTICSSYPWATIQDKLDEMTTKSGNILSNSISTFDADIGDVITANKNLGMPCGIGSVIGDADVNAIFGTKWDLFNKVSNGDFFDSSIEMLTDALSGLSCSDLMDYIGNVVDKFDINLSFLSGMDSDLSFFSSLNDEVMGLIGSVSSQLGCANDLFSAVSSASWIGEISPEYANATDSVNEAKALGGTAADIYNNSMNSINSKMGWDTQYSNLKNSFDNRLANFPI